MEGKPAEPTTIIEVKPVPGGWKVFECEGVEPVFGSKEDAIGYAQGRACFRTGEVRVLDKTGGVDRVIPFTQAGRHF